MTMTQRQIDDAQDALDAETSRPKLLDIEDIDLDAHGRCANCGQAIPKRPTHCYAVKLLLGSGERRWHYSVPLDRRDALRESNELKATGHETFVLRVDEVEQHKRQVEWARKNKKKAPALAKTPTRRRR
jgi:hypothetical protein